jgi:hypothetical protein
MSAQLHYQILVVYHLHLGDILLHPTDLELILLLVGQEVVDGVLQLTLVATDPRCDGLPGGIGNSIAARGPESRSLVSAEDSRSEDAVVMPRCSSRAQSLPVRTGALTSKDSISFASRYIFSSSASLGGG